MNRVYIREIGTTGAALSSFVSSAVPRKAETFILNDIPYQVINVEWYIEVDDDRSPLAATVWVAHTGASAP